MSSNINPLILCVERGAPNIAGNTHGTSIKGLVRILNSNAKKDTTAQATGAITNGIKRIGFATTGSPKRSGSFILKSDGIRDNLPILFICAFLKNKSIKGTGSVEPCPPIQTNH